MPGIKHSVAAGSTTAGLSILSEHHEVDVESCALHRCQDRHHDRRRPSALADDAVAVAGTLTVSDDLKLPEDAAKITHTAAAGATSAGLSITSTNYHVDVESVRQMPRSVQRLTQTSSPWPTMPWRWLAR